MYRNSDFTAIMQRRSKRTGFMLCRLLKDGSLGKPSFYQTFGSEKTPEEIIHRLEANNPGCKWVKA